MKNIWIDGYEANVPQRLGSGQVAFELLKNIEKVDKKNSYTVLFPSKPLADLPKERKGFIYKVLRPNKFWTRIAIPLALKLAKEKPDLVFSPTHYIPAFTGVKRVGVIFDLSYLKFPQMFKGKDLWQLKNWTKYSVDNASHIITISNSSKKDITSLYNVSKENVTVAYPGYDSSVYFELKDKSKISEITSQYNIEGDYIIFIGTIQPRKNLLKLIEAIKKIDNLKLLIVGKTKGLGREAWMFEEILNKPKELGIEDKVIFTGFVPTEQLPYLISGAIGFVLPSLWEGFGMPVVEAMACGVPVIVSNVSSLPEVVGNAGLLIDPNSQDQIEQSIRTLYSDKKLRYKLSKMSLKQAKKFSFRKMAKQVIKVLEEV
jgi:glycosyltransferase involved in cell wall biosynthesis